MIQKILHKREGNENRKDNTLKEKKILGKINKTS
jgi:hypothetical protein